MKIEVKNLDFKKLTEDYRTSNYIGDLLIKGTGAGMIIKNWSGLHYYPTSQQGHFLILEAEKFYGGPAAKNLTGDALGKSSPAWPSLLSAIEDRVAEKHRKVLQEAINSQAARVKAIQDNSILFGRLIGQVTKVATTPPLSMLLNDPLAWFKVIEILQKEVMPRMGKEDRVLNTNIPDHILDKAGLTVAGYRHLKEEKKEHRQGKKLR
ncbi:hypothetical protein [Olivibacter jilunii]|uniref:hypothetical protein n=1 Tax=Olivibacter jilunii TaxID=985016 RepID=UPI00102F90AC|nr:hypothetical protein [Olivibacter jilunii]